MREDHEWKVSRGVDIASETVIAEGWQIGPNGDLAFGNGLNTHDPFFVRAFAKGTWEEVSLTH